MTINVKFKKCNFCKKNAKIRDVEILKNSNTPSNCTVTYYQTLEEAPWLLRLDKPKNKNFQKPLKNLQVLSKKCNNSRCWNHSITTRNYAVTYYQTIEWVPWHLGLATGGAPGCWWGWQQSGGGQQRGGGGGNSGVGGQQLGGGGGGGLQPLRTALHTISISVQTGLDWNRAERL